VPTKQYLQGLNPAAESLYDSYADDKPRRQSYAEMVERILAAVRRGQRVCAAFYGHPGVFVAPSHEAIRRARAEGFRAQMLPGISAEDCLYVDLDLDPAIHGCQSFEASDFLVHRRRFDPASVLILWQIGAIGVATFKKSRLWSRQGLEVLAEVLLEHYPDEHEVVVYEAANYPVCRPMILRVPLARLAAAEVSVASTLCIPPRAAPKKDREMMKRLGMVVPAES
jgi:uncharacterized protein YabN with tetrapyrrole methylase and pyrophosphatase domain